MIYDKLEKKPKRQVLAKEKTDELIVNYNFVNGCFVEIVSGPEDEYDVFFVNKETEQVLYSSTIKNGEWSKCSFTYYIDWIVVIKNKKGDILRAIEIDLKDKRVFIPLDSKSLGDTLAWMPYAEEFRKKHDCKVILSTYMNELFKETYPNLQFAEPGDVVENIIAQYGIGWYHEGEDVNFFRNPLDPKHQPMQKTASDILGLEFEEIKPKLKLPKAKKTKTVTIGFHSTAQCKYWNNPTGWSQVVNYIKGKKKRKALSLSSEGPDYMGNQYPEGLEQFPKSSINKVIEQLVNSELFIGIGSGLSWLAWACDVPMILISGFSEPFTEMQEYDKLIRIGTPEGKRLTSGCFNKYKFDPSNWNWYEPKQFVGTERQFECSKSISYETVKTAIDKFLK